MRGVGRWRRRPGVLHAAVIAARGSVVGAYGDSRDRLAVVSATARTAAAAGDRAAGALADIDVRLEEAVSLCC
jgi:predicted regulator of Ras-like GTPase activity (Roadblock/LC7/MglB family)